MYRFCVMFAMIAAPCLADVQITTSYTADGQTAQTTIWSNGSRMRYDYGSGVVMLRYCDQPKLMQIDEKAKSYLLLPAEEAAKPAAPKVEVADSGETKELFGHPARHLKIVETIEGKKGRTETDGWYIDLRAYGSCFALDSNLADRGYPASYSITTYGENGKPTSTVSMRVTSLAETTLASSMFEVPAGYQDSTPREVPKGATPKAAGVIRVGLVPVRDPSKPGVHNEALYGRLVSQLMEVKLDLMQLPDGPQEAIDRKAGESACDFVLYTEVANVGKPASGKVTGLLHKAPGLGHVTGGDGMEARIDYRLVPATGGEPVLASSATGKAGTAINWKSAALLASNLIPMGMAARMFGSALNPAMMNALLSGGGYGASMASMDPMMGGIATLIRAATSGGAQGNNGQNPMAAEAMAAAIDLEGKAIISQLKLASH